MASKVTKKSVTTDDEGNSGSGNSNAKTLKDKSVKTRGLTFRPQTKVEPFIPEKKLNQAVFHWKIPHFRRLTDSKSIFGVGSPTFPCAVSKQQLSEWYLTLDYHPRNFGQIKIGLFLKNIKGAGANEIRVHATLSLLKTRGGVAISLGSLKKNFRIVDPTNIFQRRGERRCCGNQPQSQCHECFNVISMEDLYELQDQILADNVLQLRVEVKAWEMAVMTIAEPKKKPIFSTETLPMSIPKPVPYWDIRPNADFVIMCEEEDFKVHADLISAASPVFATMVEEMTELNEQNPEIMLSKVVVVSDVESEIMAKMLEYIYSGSLGDFELCFGNPIIMEKLLNAATAYKLFSLRNICFYKMCIALNMGNIGKFALIFEDFKAPPEMKMVTNKYLRSNWNELQQYEEFRDLFKNRPDAFEFVFSDNRL